MKRQARGMAALLVSSEQGGTICSGSFYHTPIVGQLTDAVNPLSSSLMPNGIHPMYSSSFTFSVDRRPSALTSASTGPRMSKSGPLRTATAGRSLSFAALCSRRESADYRRCETDLAGRMVRRTGAARCISHRSLPRPRVGRGRQIRPAPGGFFR